MKNIQPYQASAINALVLILVGSYTYSQSSMQPPSSTCLIPVVFCIILFALNTGVYAVDKIFSHIAVTAPLLILIG